MISYSLAKENLSKFLESSVFHTQISAVRALAATSFNDRNELLMAFVVDPKKNLLARVIAVQMIEEVKATELRERIASFSPNASTERVGLGISVMDPRVGTRTSLKQAIEELLDHWK